MPFTGSSQRDLHGQSWAGLDWKFSKHTSYIQVLLLTASRNLTSLQVIFHSLDPWKWVLSSTKKKNQLHLEQGKKEKSSKCTGLARNHHSTITHVVAVLQEGWTSHWQEIACMYRKTKRGQWWPFKNHTVWLLESMPTWHVEILFELAKSICII